MFSMVVVGKRTRGVGGEEGCTRWKNTIINLSPHVRLRFLAMKSLFVTPGLNLLRNEAQQTLLAIDHSCLAIIAVTAGAELHFDSIKRVHKQVRNSQSGGEGGVAKLALKCPEHAFH